MLTSLQLNSVGPASNWTLAFSPRLNVLTGENGLGKSLILEAIWAGITWHKDALSGFTAAQPDAGAREPKVEFSFGVDPSAEPSAEKGAAEPPGAVFTFDRREQAWDERLRGSNWPRGLSVFARADGQIAINDASLPWTAGGQPRLVQLTPAELLDGKTDATVQGSRRTVCAGMVADWVRWQEARAPQFATLQTLLGILGPPGDPIAIGQPTRVRIDDRRDIPTVTMSYGAVPITLAPAGLRRCLGLIYALIWAWTDHERTAAVLGIAPTRDVTVLLDEPETHLHPQWQRVFLPALLRAVHALAPEASVQLFVATHSPIVLASLETVFCEGTDDLFHLSRRGGVVRAEELPFGKEGDASAWLESDVFDRVGARSREAELATEAAMHASAGRDNEAEAALSQLADRFAQLPGPITWAPSASAPLRDRVHQALNATLSDLDPFWPQWLVPTRSRA